MSALLDAARSGNSARVRAALAETLDDEHFVDLLILELASWREPALRDFVIAHVRAEMGPGPDQVTITLVDPPS